MRLIHRSGHACVLNSLALRLCGIGMDTEEPAGGSMERDPASGEPSGLLLEMNELVDRAVPPLDGRSLLRACAWPASASWRRASPPSSTPAIPTARQSGSFCGGCARKGTCRPA